MKAHEIVLVVMFGLAVVFYVSPVTDFCWKWWSKELANPPADTPDA